MIISNIKSIAKSIIPKSMYSYLVPKIEITRHQKFLSQLRSDILNYYSQKANVAIEEQEVIDYLKSNPVTIFPYDFQNKYNKQEISVDLDPENGLRYVWHEGKKLYFKRSYGVAKIRSLYHGLQLDQDADSPHLYLKDNFQLSAEDVIADIGAAEGNFSLSNVEKVKKIHLFEYDSEWIEALTATFKPWQEKVTIHNKFVSDNNSAQTISIDHFTETERDITFFKVDIEGEEARFLAGAQQYLHTQSNLKIAICTYHKQGDEVAFVHTLKSHGFHVNPSNRFMIFYHDAAIGAPFLRRGLLRADKLTVNG